VTDRADPRSNQKLRTRGAIVAAGIELMREGRLPAVAEAAAAAKVSRATAYRYFPTAESFHIEIAGVSPAFAPIEQLLDAGLTGDAAGRLSFLIDSFNTIAFAEQARMRMALKVYLDTWLAGQRSDKPVPRVREGRRMRWLDQVLEPVAAQLPPARLKRLRAALALTLGADAMVVMKDVCGLDEAEAGAVLDWAAQALLAAGLADCS
jgi:AcrR family transcriptional regulator